MPQSVDQDARTPHPHTTHHAKHGKNYGYTLALAALGVVYGDIGTSPLYALRESFHANHGLAVTEKTVLGILSLIIWSLIVIISIKYVSFIMRADNDGEGGILALTALVTPLQVKRGGGKWVLILLGLFGTALLYGDGIITPAISVLSAVEGLEIATPFFHAYILPITCTILIMLFISQRFGTARVGRIFGPVMVFWFAAIALLGIGQIAQNPAVFAAFNPIHAVEFFSGYGFRAFAVLGSVVLCVTGGEALYADMGHFGKTPIRRAWFAIVLPALLLNYLGQGAAILRDPAAAHNPFYNMVPSFLLYPVVVLATAATVIASQALISGAFSLTAQAIQLGYMPRFSIRHTSRQEHGQIYIPSVNWMLMLACLALVLVFQSSSNLAAAYGVAVTMTMVITTMLFYVFTVERWKWPQYLAVPLCVTFLIIDLAFFGANVLKIPQGGWFPLVVAGVIFVFLTTWKRGRALLSEKLDQRVLPLAGFMADLQKDPPARVPGTAIYMFRSSDHTPYSLAQNVKTNKVLHERILLLSVRTLDVPRVMRSKKLEVTELGNGFYQILINVGFMEEPNVPRILKSMPNYFPQLELDLDEVIYFVGRETVFAAPGEGMAQWRERLFAFMSRNAASAWGFYHLPPGQVVELGAQVAL